MNTPDIEIYAKNISADIILEWLSKHFEKILIAIGPQALAGKTTVHGTVEYNKSSIPISITPQAAGKSFCSIWFKSADTPWENDEQCAQSLLELYDIEVRCSAAGWSEEEDEMSEQWLYITRNEKKLIRWG
jgi:hypothetical protein